MARSKLHLRIAQSRVLRYGLAVASVAIALATALPIERLQIHTITLFLVAIAVAASYRVHFFVEASQSISYLILFALFAWLASWFSAVRRRVEEELLRKPVDFHEFVNAVKEPCVFWGVINEPSPESVRK